MASKAVVKKVAAKPDGAAKPAVKKAEPKKEDKPKAEEAKAEEAPAEEAPAAEEEAPKEPEKPKEAEVDAAADSRKKVSAGDVCFNMSEATLNALPTNNSKLLMSLSDGGFQYLLAGVRSTAGLKGGRYMFEAKIVENLNPSEPQGSKGPAPRQLVRVGFSTAGSSVFLSETNDNFCFDSEGFFTQNRKRSKAGQPFSFGDTLAVLLNLDSSSPNANTVSLFKNGVRASEPQALPEALKGKALFPTVTYKNVTLQVNYGPKPLTALPFSCRMVKDAAAADVEIAKQPKDGSHEVLFPVGMPDEGVFEWANQFIVQNPQFTEISDRKIIEWAARSGIHRPKPFKGATDSPEFNFGIPLLDDLSVRKLLSIIAPTLNRSFLVMELKSNLIPEERKEALERFGDFKKVAVVAMGEPNAEYIAKVHADLLAQKKAKAEEAKKKAVQTAERAKLMEAKKKQAATAKKERLAAQRAKEGKEEEAEEEVKEEEEEKKEEDVKMEEPEDIVLTEEEKKTCHKKQPVVDLGQATLTKFYAKFALPEKAEGFDEVRYVWQPQNDCAKKLGDWVKERKMTQRVDDLEPGAWFKENHTKWTKTLSDWRRKQGDFKDPVRRKAALAKKKTDAAKKKAEEKKAAAEGEENAEGEEKEAEPEEDEAMEIDPDDLDVFAVEDINDIGNGEPLYANFSYEDWTLATLRAEFHLMLHSWKKDLNDDERPSFKETHLAFYYKKYFKKDLTFKNYGVETFTEFVDFIKEAVVVNETSGFLESQLAEDLPFGEFVKLAEEHRRDRQRRVDAGDESALIKFTKPQPVAQPGVARQPGANQAYAVAPGIKRMPPAGPPPASKFPRTMTYGAPQPTRAYGAPAGYGGGAPPGYGAPAVGVYGRPTAYGMQPSPYGMHPAPGGMGGGYYRRV